MPVLEILTAPHPMLKRRAEPVAHFDEALQRLASDMIETMRVRRGYGLAAPQVGESLRMITLELGPMTQDDSAPADISEWERLFGPALALINPAVLETEGPEVSYNEGCLSVPTIREMVKRPQRISVRFQTLDGKEHRLSANGVLAVAIQHEIDHLDGKIFLDRLPVWKRDFLMKKLRKLKAPQPTAASSLRVGR